MPMQKLIRSKLTKAFLKPDFTWTFDIMKAMRLTEPPVLRVLVAHHPLSDLELYFSFSDIRLTRSDYAMSLV